MPITGRLSAWFGQYPVMRYSTEDMAWINRKAVQFADQSEHVDEMALSLARAEFKRLSRKPRAEVIPMFDAARDTDEPQ